MRSAVIVTLALLAAGQASAQSLGLSAQAPTPTPLTYPPAPAPAPVNSAPSQPIPQPHPTHTMQPTSETQPNPAASAAPAPTALPVAPPTPIPPPGAWVYGNWKAWHIGGGADLILVRDMAYDAPVNVIEAPFTEPTILRRLLTFSFKDFMQFGEQPTLEKAIDLACALNARDPKAVPARTIEDVAHEFLGDSGADSMLKHPDKNTPYFIGATLSSMRKPEKLERADAPAQFAVVSAVASCKEPAGKRFHLAQKRGFNTQVTNNVRALTWLIDRWISSKVAEVSTDKQRESIKAQALAVAIKTIRLSLIKMHDYQIWLQSPEGKELGGDSVWDAPLTPLAQGYARGLTAMLETQLKGLRKVYDDGAARDGEDYPAIPDSALLADKDLNILF